MIKKNWVGNKNSIFKTLGASNHVKEDIITESNADFKEELADFAYNHELLMENE